LLEEQRLKEEQKKIAMSELEINDLANTVFVKKTKKS